MGQLHAASLIVGVMVVMSCVDAATAMMDEGKLYVATDGNDHWSGKLPAPDAAGTIRAGIPLYGQLMRFFTERCPGS